MMLILLQRIMTSPLWQVKLLYCTKVKDYLGRLKLAWIFADFSDQSYTHSSLFFLQLMELKNKKSGNMLSVFNY